MRPGLLVALFLAFAALVGVVHWDRQGRPRFWSSVLARSEAEGDPAPAAAPPPVELEPPPPGWARVVLGAPSGAEPRQEPGAPAPAPAPAEHFLPDFELVVRPGQALSRIAREHYGTDAAWLVEALARYNDLDDPDSLEVGQTLYLPEAEKLVD